jgi:integrase
MTGTIPGRPSFRFYARFFDDSGKVVKTRALKATTATKAALEAKVLLDTGAAAGADPLVVDLVQEAWTPGSNFLRKRKKSCSPAYVRTSQRTFNLHYAPWLAGVRFSRLTPAIVEKAMTGLLDAGIGPRTVNYGRQALTVVVADHARSYRIPNPLQYLWKPEENPRERGILSTEELSRIVSMNPLQHTPRDRLAVLLGALCGMRLGEVRGLQLDDVDFDRKTIRVQHNYIDGEGMKKPKAGSTRTVPAPDVVLEAIRLAASVAPAGSTYAVAGDRPGRPTLDRTISNGFIRILKAIGIDDDERTRRNLVFHGLRHTFVSMSRMAGVPDFMVQRLAGHKSSAMMDRYSHASENVVDFADARERMANTIEAARVKPAAKDAGGAS